MNKILFTFFVCLYVALFSGAWGYAGTPLHIGPFVSLENQEYEVNSKSGESLAFFQKNGGYCVKETDFAGIPGRILTPMPFQSGPSYHLHRRGFYLSYVEWVALDVIAKVLLLGGHISLTGALVLTGIEYAVFEYRFREEVKRAFADPFYGLRPGDFKTLKENIIKRNGNPLYTLSAASCY